MKKFFLSFVLSLCAGLTALAQNALLATLSHDGTVSTFYGADALREAHAAATDGDVITLSSGTFNSVNITKAITLRGAGMEVDSLRGTLPTIISGDFDFCVSDTLLHRVTVEGIYSNNTAYVRGTLKNAMILKSRFNRWSSVNYGVMKDVSFIHCKIMGNLYAYRGSSFSCVGCCLSGNNSSSNSVECTNCIFMGSLSNWCDGTLVNCIMNGSSTSYIPGTKTYNCVAYGGATNFFRKVPNSTNKVVADASALFKTYTGTADDNTNFELTESAAATYLGTDGTQVGIYGGSLPFDATPTNPQITKCNVAAKSTADGKLSVDITVNAAE